MMSTRLAILELTARHRLDATTLASLWRIARLDEPPAKLLQLMRRGLVCLASLFAGLGLIFLVAANLDAVGRAEKFLFLQLLVGATCFGAARFIRTRQALALLGLLAIGSLFAYFGQTYQTGADPWQLFAIWAALALPLALGARSEIVWSAWLIIASTGLAAWDAAQSGQWRFSGNDLLTHFLVASMAAVLAVLMSPFFSRFTGAGKWAFNLATLLATVSVVATGILALSVGETNGTGVYCAALGLLGPAAVLLARRSLFDVSALSFVALGLVFLLVAVFWRAMLNGSGDLFGILFAMGITAIGLMALSIWSILSLMRHYGSGGTQ